MIAATGGSVGRESARFAPATLRAAGWALWAVWRTRRSLRTDGLKVVRMVPPRGLPWSARRGVLGVLRRLEPTCLERSLVLQSWLAAHDRAYDVVVGVAKDGGETKAHAWLGYEQIPPDALGYRELLRLPPP